MSAFQRFRHLVYRIETRYIGLSQSGSASPQSPCSRPPAFSATSMAVRALGGEGWNQTQFPCCTGHRAYPSVCCALRVRMLSHQHQQLRCDIAYTSRSKAAPERGYLLIWRRKRVVNRVVAALIRAVASLKWAYTALYRVRCYMVGR